MSTFRIRRPSAALIVSVVALVVALGGTSYAAFSLPKNSVGARELKSRSVTTSKLKNHSVTKAKLNLSGLIVPGAAHAITADTAKTATSAQQATHATSADSASAVAYAHVLPTGALDAEHSKNVGAVTRTSVGVYCLKVTVPVSNVAATVDLGSTGKFGIAIGVLSGQDPQSLLKAFCHAGENVLIGTAAADTGTADDRGFWATFN
jgi:hypothetical protein